jgi:tRNA-modifying protein YgfZ
MITIKRQPSGILRVTRHDAVDFLHRLSTKDLLKLALPKHVVSTLFTTAKGKLVDWARVYRMDDAVWLLPSEPSRAAVLKSWLDDYVVIEDVVIEPHSPEFDLVTVDGAAALDLVPSVPLGEFQEHNGQIWTSDLACFPNSRCGLVPRGEADSLVTRLLERGASLADDAAWELRRLQAGVPSPQHEFAEQVNPLELRLTAEAVSWNKGCYIGQEVISRMDSYDKIARVLMGVEVDEGVELSDTTKLQRADKPLGTVTSSLVVGNSTIALAIVKHAEASAGPVDVVVGSGIKVAGRLVDRPFWATN